MLAWLQAISGMLSGVGALMTVFVRQESASVRALAAQAQALAFPKAAAPAGRIGFKVKVPDAGPIVDRQ